MPPMVKVQWKPDVERHQESTNRTTTPTSYFDFPSVVKTEEQFMSWASVTMLLLLILFFRSSASAFINPTGEQRRKTSTYTHVTILLYCWVLSATALTVIPHFSTHYNEIIAAALFFPMMFATVAALLVGRLLIRLAYYAYGGCLKHNKVAADVITSTTTAASLPQQPTHRKKPTMLISFHRPFRKLVRTSALCSASICFLYAHCWSRDLSAFKVNVDDGAGAVCRAVFSPYTFGGFVFDGGRGADESCIWCLWGCGVMVLLSFYMLDEFAGKNRLSQRRNVTLPSYPSDTSLERHQVNDQPRASTTGVSGYISDQESFENNSNDDETSLTSNPSTEGEDLSEDEMESDESVERPEGTMPMVSWYSILLFHTVFDILIELKVFLGRFDARTLMQPAEIPQSAPGQQRGGQIDKDKQFDPTLYPSGSVFDCRPRNKSSNQQNIVEDNQELWFDFMADCGDGFDSSYQIARMLAQPQLAVKSQGTSGTRRVLPRGNFLVVGGDLAYPHPTEESYEKRFFRTFEDALPPPPSFRRNQISVNKPALPVKGWKNCFSDKLAAGQSGKDVSNLYKGPRVFLIPGNHDWYDGLATFSRFVLSRDWLGGWLMPQKRSYFALKLTHGWWLLAFDLGLSQDIDLNQFHFFANVAANEMGASDSCIIVTHEPSWVLSADEKLSTPDELPEKHLRELMRHHLGKRIRARFAGDLHHYTRHVPMRSRSFSNGSAHASTLPQLIVSGGGGAFLHGTHTYENRIRVGEDQEAYTRVKAFPDEKTSYRLSWLNMWQFRWRNWAFDMFGACVYFGIASSSFPLCGIYSDYLAYNPSHGILYVAPWLGKTVLGLLAGIFSSGNISLFVTVALTLTLYMVTDPKLKPSTRLFWSLSHTLMHIASALACLVFVECIAEWSIQEGIVKVVTTTKRMKRQDEGIDLASSLYAEYKEHFSGFFSSAIPPPSLNETSLDFTPFQQFHAQAYYLVENAASWIYHNVPLLKTTLEVFDLPGTITQKHTDMCKILCSGGVECLLRSSKTLFLQIDRGTLLSYLGAVSLYFFILAIPFAGNVFGTWLALTLNIFRAQPNEGFSSLRIRHWKNFLRLHIKENGDLEVFAIGLHRVPKRWIKDTLWDGNFDENSMRKYRNGRTPEGTVRMKPVSPSFSWERPSKWIPAHHSKRFEPEVIDYTCIPRTRHGDRSEELSNGIIGSKHGNRSSFR